MFKNESSWHFFLFSLSVMLGSLRPCGLPHARLPCPSNVPWSLLKLMSVESVMPTSHLILCRPLLLLPSILPSKRLFSSELALHIRLPKYWSFSFSISPSNDYPSNDWFHLGLTALKLINKLKSIENFCLLRQIAKCSKKGCCDLCSHRQWLGWLDTAPSSEFWNYH